MPVKEKTKPARKTKATKPAKAKPAKKPTPARKPEAVAPAPAPAPAASGIFTAPPNLKAHPAAEMLPPMDIQEYDALKARISNEGVLEPIKLIIVQSPNGMAVQQILDGRHRYRICGELGIDCPAILYTGDVPPYTYVTSIAHKRNMDETQKACAAVGLLPKLEEEAKARQLAGLKVAGAPVRYQNKTREEVETELWDLDDKELEAAYRTHTGKDSANKLAFDLVWGILDAWFPQSPAGKAAEHASRIFGCGARYVEMAKAVSQADPDLFKKCFSGQEKLSRAIAQVNRQRRAAEQKQSIEAAKKAGVATAEWQIITGDNRDELPKLDRRSARLVFGDIPYNEGFDYGGRYNDSLPDSEYLDLCEEWIDAAVPLIADDGAIAIMCSGHYSDYIGQFLRQHDLHRFNTIVWVESFGSYTDNNWTNCWRPIHVYSRQSRPLFNSHAVRVPSWRLANGDGRGDPAGKVPSNVWEFPRIVGNSAERVIGEHPLIKDGFPTQLPVALVERLVLTLTDPGDLVIDPWNGSGTTGVAAIRNARRYIGIELEPVFADAARERLSGTTPMI